MGSTHRFLAIGDESELVLDWFRHLPSPPQETPAKPRGRWLHFRDLGPLTFREGPGSPPEVDPKRSPLVSFFAARCRRGLLWTAGEVHFLPTPLKPVFPQLDAINRRFVEWLSQFERVFSRRSPVDDWRHYLEGSIQNHDSDVFALPAAMTALRQGQYFIADDDSAGRVETLCRTLQLRGIKCAAEDEA